MATLKQRTISGVKWQMVNKVAQKLLTVITFAILARMLEPSVFGLFAMGFIAIDGFHIFRSFGLDAALVQRKERLDEAMHTAFWIMQATGIFLFAVCFFAAPAIAHFFKHSELILTLRALGIVFIFSNFSRIPNSLLTRQLRFDLIAMIEISGAVIYCLFAVIFAQFSASVWSLVWAYILKQMAMSALSLYFSSFRVKFTFDPTLAKELLHFGKFMTGLGILWYISMNVNNIIIGRVLGASILGYFTLANNIGNFINTHFTQLISSAMFPAYAQLQDNQEVLKRAYLKSIRFVSILSFPFAVALICLAEEIVLTLYGPKWLPVIPLIRLFGVLQLTVPIMACSGPVFLGAGKPKNNVILTTINLLIRIPLFIFFLHQWGLSGAVISLIIANLVTVPINNFLVKRIIGFSYREFFSQIVPSFFCALLTCLTLAGLKKLFEFEMPPTVFTAHLISLVLFSSFSITVYSAFFYLIDRPAILEVKKMIFKG